MLTPKDMAVLDANSEYLGVSVETLMENAGFGVASILEREFGTGKRIAVLCGCGNNGGDGFVAARYLRERNDVDVILAKSADNIKGQAAWNNYEKVQEITKAWVGQELGGYDLLVDALLGTGFSGEPKEPFVAIIKAINSSGVPVLAVDLPSGLGSANVVRPNLTVSFHDMKLGMSEKNSGKVMVYDIGIPEDASRYCGPGDYAYYPIPVKTSHKGQNGRVLVIGGGPYTGAPFLAAMGAYRIGADLVFIAAPSSVSDTISGYSPNVIVNKLPGSILSPGDLGRLRAMLRDMNSVLIGSGVGRDPQTFESVRNFVKVCDVPIVIDADSFAALSGNLDLLKGKSGIMTPHGGEFLKLTGEELASDLDSRAEQCRELAKRTGITVLLKGAVDIVTDGKEIRLNRTGNPGMSVGGTGDVLAGICAGLLAKGVPPFHAARIGAFTNGAAGDLAFDDCSYGLLATDVIENVPLVMRKSLDNFR
ncbi:MAG: putative carbohydrate kinase [Methanomassiliicoccales archaeon PtaU1.Bin124]|nr:MAG: putative carbohydrate kinase [Methanomassiliicoccales archaeon PtaU1.Bin124]